MVGALGLAEKQQMPIYSIRFAPIGDRTHYTPLEHANHYINDAVLSARLVILPL